RRIRGAVRWRRDHDRVQLAIRLGCRRRAGRRAGRARGQGRVEPWSSQKPRGRRIPLCYHAYEDLKSQRSGNRVHIETVELADFRSYESLLFNPVPKLNILTGPNAQGKTNLLEGLALLAVGRSFRGAKPLEMTRWGAKSAAVSGEIRRGDSSRRLRRILAPREDGVWSL